jgi:hypothetical protein
MDRRTALHFPRIDLTVDPQFILRNCYAKDGDIVVVAGTLVEGIGNYRSDIDVYVIAEDYPRSSTIDLSQHHRVLSTERDIVRSGMTDRDVLLIHTVVPGTSVKVDVEFKRISDLKDLFAKIKEVFNYASKNLILLTKRLNERDEILVHRLLNCIPLQGETQLKRLLTGISRDEYLYIAYRWVASDFAILLDLAGAWEANELDRAVEFARENVIVQTSGYLRLRGITNLRRKWLMTYLEQLPDSRELLEEFRRLMYLRGTEDEDGKRSYVLNSLDYVDELYVASLPWLARLPGVPSGQQGIAILSRDREENGGRNDYSDWEYEYRAKAYGAASPRTRSHFKTILS